MKEERLLMAMTEIDAQLIQTHAPAPAEQSAVLKKHIPLRILLVAAAASVLLGTTALAASPSLRDALLTALGGFTPYVVVQNETIAVDQGIQVKAVAALADSMSIKVYAEITDIAADRLAQSEISGTVEMALEDEYHSSFNTSQVAYDAETKTALVCFTSQRGALISGQTEAVLKVQYIRPGHFDFAADPIPVSVIPADYAKSQILDSGKTVLVPGQTEYPLEGENACGVVLSSVGFTPDGALHFLFRYPAEAINGDALFSLWHSKFGRNFQRVEFQQDGILYLDRSFYAAPENLPDIEYIPSVEGEFETAAAIQGDWELPITVVPVDSICSPISGHIDRSELQELTLSPLGVILSHTSDPDAMLIGHHPMTVWFSDGSHSQLSTFGQDASQKEAVHRARWEFDQPVEVRDITAIAIGQWYVPVENGIAQPGHWLNTIPK